jgi:hypothetical protein
LPRLWRFTYRLPVHFTAPSLPAILVNLLNSQHCFSIVVRFKFYR